MDCINEMWKSPSRVLLFVTPWTLKSMEFSRPEWEAFPFSRGSSQPRDWTQDSALQANSLPAEPQGKPKNTGVGSLSFLQRIFWTQESPPGLLHYRRIFTNWAIRESHRLYSSWTSPGKNTGLGSHYLLQGIFPTRDQTLVSHIAGGFFTSWAVREALVNL